LKVVRSAFVIYNVWPGNSTSSHAIYNLQW